MNEINGSDSRGSDIQNISEKYKGELSGTWGAYVGEVAEKILNDEFLSIEDPAIFYFLDTLEDNVEIPHLPAELNGDRILILNEIAGYVMKSAMSEDPEDQERYRKFFALDSELEGKEIKERVFAAMDVVEVISKFGIENSELNRKLFEDIYVENGLRILLEGKKNFNYTNEARDLYYYFPYSRFYNDEANVGVLQGFTYNKILEIYDTFTESRLSEFDYDMVEITREIFESEWFLDDDIKKSFLDNTKLQEKLIKADIITKKEWGIDGTVETPLEIFENNITGFKDKTYIVRRDKLKDNMESILNIIYQSEERFLSEVITKNWESGLLKSVKNIKNLYDDESGMFLKSLEEVLDSKGVYVEEVISPILSKLIKKIDGFYEAEEKVWGNYIYFINREILCSLGERVGNIDSEIEEAIFKKIKKEVLNLREEYFYSEHLIIGETNIKVLDEEIMKKLGINDLKDINLRPSLELDRENLEEKFDIAKEDIIDIFNTYQTVKILLSINGLNPK